MTVWPYVLRRGHSNNPADGACAMDAVNWLVHGEHGDAPECACPVIAAYVIQGNDAMPDDVRQRLLPYLHRIAGSRSVEHETARMRVLVLGALRIFAPNALDTASLHEHAAALRSLPDDINWQTAARAAAARAAAARAAASWAEAAAAWAEAAAKAASAASGAAAAAARAAKVPKAASAASGAAAAAARAAASWDDYFTVLDAALTAGPQGEPWSADVVSLGVKLYADAAGV